MKIKTNTLTGAALDWAVAKIDNRKIGFNLGGGLEVRGRTEDGEELPEQWDLWMPWHPSTDWAQGGPIIEHHIFALEDNDSTDDVERWLARGGDGTVGCGPTPLIAAMRCYCCSKLGDEIDIPEELCQSQNS